MTYVRITMAHDVTKRTIKNLSALTIVLAGMFAGSLFVDIAQLVTGSGFSRYAVKTHDILVAGEKTWVAYDDPKTSLKVVTDSSCAECDPSEALIWLRRVLPTVEAVSVESDSDDGKALIDRFDIMTLPAFVFSSDIAQTDFYSQASSLFRKNGGLFLFDMGKIGLAPGKYIKLPEINDQDRMIGQKDAPVKIIVFSDFQCSFCGTFHQELVDAVAAHAGDVAVVFKELPLAIHKQAGNAAEASLCAAEQGKSSEYADYLFKRQAEWSKLSGTQRFKEYAWRLGLDGRRFAACLEDGRYKSKLDADAIEAERFNISGVPAAFVNGVFIDGAVKMDDMERVIEAELKK
jgi:protein-disulfide isomerase